MKISECLHPTLFGNGESDRSTSLPLAVPAKTSPSPENGTESPEREVLFSGRLCDSLKLFDLLGWCLRTCQVCSAVILRQNRRRTRYRWAEPDPEAAPDCSEVDLATENPEAPIGMWTKQRILELSSLRFENAGIMSDTEFWTGNGSEWPSDGAACSLSDVLEQNVSPRFSLSSPAATGILRRAEECGKRLPEHLAAALESVAGAATPSE